MRTNLTADVPPTPHTVEPDHYASSLMCWLGKERRCHGCLTHEVVVSSVQFHIVFFFWFAQLKWLDKKLNVIFKIYLFTQWGVHIVKLIELCFYHPFLCHYRFFLNSGFQSVCEKHNLTEHQKKKFTKV